MGLNSRQAEAVRWLYCTLGERPLQDNSSPCFLQLLPTLLAAPVNFPPLHHFSRDIFIEITVLGFWPLESGWTGCSFIKVSNNSLQKQPLCHRHRRGEVDAASTNGNTELGISAKARVSALGPLAFCDCSVTRASRVPSLPLPPSARLSPSLVGLACVCRLNCFD